MVPSSQHYEQLAERDAHSIRPFQSQVHETPMQNIQDMYDVRGSISIVAKKCSVGLIPEITYTEASVFPRLSATTDY
jgi:hypothetical protein